MKILLVEDRPEWIILAQEQFKGHDITVVSNCADATRIRCHKYDLVLTDVNLPVGDPAESGLEMCHRFTGQSFPAGLVVALSAILWGVPCVVVTDTTAHNDAIACLIEYLCDPSKPEISGIPWKNKCVHLETRRKDWLEAVRRSPWKNLVEA